MTAIHFPILHAPLVILITCASIGGASITNAADTAWSNDARSAMRLIAGAYEAGKPLMAGVEIKLQPGWHTYWRYPGESGVPPHFDFSGSVNLKSAEVLYPAPQVHKEGGGQSLGYDEAVIFPIKITPKEPGQPVRLTVTLAYAVCEKICIPASGHAELSITAGESTHEQALKAALARVPKLTSAADVGLLVRRITGAKPAIEVSVRALDAENAWLIVEGPTPHWALPIPRPEPGTQGSDHRLFTFELDGLPPGADPAAPLDLTFTLVKGNGGFEVKTHLD